MWLNPQVPADLATFTEEILNEKLNFLCSVVDVWQSSGYLPILDKKISTFLKKMLRKEMILEIFNLLVPGVH